MPGARSTHRDANGMEVADVQPGYYDNGGHWRSGPAAGYYDSRGAWIATAPSAGATGMDASYVAPREHTEAPRDIATREAWLDQRIRSGASDESISHEDARHARRELRSIREQEQAMRHDGGQLSPSDEANIQARLDSLSSELHVARQDAVANH